MRSRFSIVGLGLVCGAALWASFGVLDVAGPPNELVRVAMLPSWWVLVGFVVATTGALIGLGALLTRAAARRGHALPPDDVVDALRPLAASGLLLIPYLPWLPDVLPVLLALASTLRWLVWLIVVAQAARGVWCLLGAWREPSGAGGSRFATLVIAACLCGSVVAASRLAGTILYPTGDEPHYLVMAQSLWRDGDLRIENNHERGDYFEYFARSELPPHYLTRGVDGEIYSVHPVGLPIVLAPVYGAAGYVGVLAVLIGIAAASGVTLLWWMRRLRLAGMASALAWLAVGMSTPFLFHSFAVYPETTAGLAVALSLTLATTGSGVAGRWVIVGLTAALLPWLSTKYAPMAAVAILVALGRIWYRSPAGRRESLRASVALLAPFGLGGVAWLSFFWIYWGRLSPSAPYGAAPGMTLEYLSAGVPGLFFDQEFGILPYAPVLLLGLVGLGRMWRSGAADRRLTVEISLVFAALLGTVGAFHIWWGGTSPPGRPLVSGLALLAVPIAWLLARDRTRPLRMAAYELLLLWSIGTTLLLMFQQEGLLIISARDGVSRLLAYLSPLWPLTNMAPSFIVLPPLLAVAVVVLWLGLVAAGVAVLRWRRPVGAGRSVLAVTVMAVCVMVAGSILAPRVIGPRGPRGSGGSRPFDASMRAEFGLLGHFDVARRPVGVVYAPASVVPPAELLSRFSYRVEPPVLPPDSTGPPLLHGRRLVLPAGRYRVDLEADRPDALAGTLSLQLGRIGAPMHEWPVTPTAGPWSREVDLGTDVRYAGFLASPELEQAGPRVRVVPLSIVDASVRVVHPPVVSARAYAEGSVFFLDTNVFDERDGFWIQSGRTARFVVTLTGAPDPSATFRIHSHCGPVSNDVRISSDEVDEPLRYEPGDGAFGVTIPAPAGRTLVTFETTSGFVPADLDPENRDERRLGCWVAMDGWTVPADRVPRAE